MNNTVWSANWHLPLCPAAKKTLTELRQLYFQLKEQIFAHDRYGFAYNTAALEEILKEAFGTEVKMSDVTFPRYYFSPIIFYMPVYVRV